MARLMPLKLPTLPAAVAPSPGKQSLRYILNSPGAPAARPADLLLHLSASAWGLAELTPLPRSASSLGRVPCTRCKQTFKDRASLRKHHRVVHLKVRNHACGVCARRFAEKSNLRKHVVAVHEHGRDHACKLCDKSFSFADGLRRHVNNCHLGLRPHKCACCAASFKQRTHLQKHLSSIHPGTRFD